MELALILTLLGIGLVGVSPLFALLTQHKAKSEYEAGDNEHDIVVPDDYYDENKS